MQPKRAEFQQHWIQKLLRSENEGKKFSHASSFISANSALKHVSDKSSYDVLIFDCMFFRNFALNNITPFLFHVFLVVYSNKSKFPSNRLKAPSFPEFEQLYWQEFKLRQQKLKEDKKLLVSAANVQL